MLFEFRQTGKELYSVEFRVVNESGDMLGTVLFKGNMVSVYRNWNISLLSMNISDVAAGKASISRKGKTNMKNHIIIFSVLMIFCFVAVGCSSMSLKDIDGDIRCEFRTGENAEFADAVVNTDATFEKEEFVKLYNEANSYNPNRIKDHLNECDLRISPETQPDEWKEIFGSEVNIKMLYGEKGKSVSVYRHGSKLYFFIVSIGGRTRPEDEGHYYIELSEEADRYWRPILDKVIREG